VERGRISWRWAYRCPKHVEILLISNKSLFVASSWSHLYLVIKDARSFEHKVKNRYVNPFQPKLILVHNTITGTSRRAYKTCKNWPLCSYVGWHQHNQPNAEKSAQCAEYWSQWTKGMHIKNRWKAWCPHGITGLERVNVISPIYPRHPRHNNLGNIHCV